MMYVIRRLQELARKIRDEFRCMYALSTLPKRTTPLIEPSSEKYSPVLACHRILTRSFVNSTVACDGMRAVRLGDRVCSRCFAAEQGLRQGCVLATLLFNIFFAAVINGASTRFKADKGIVDALVHLRKKSRAGGRGEATAGESVLATPLRSMLYADDAGVVSQPPKQRRKTMGVIVVVCAAFGLPV